MAKSKADVAADTLGGGSGSMRDAIRARKKKQDELNKLVTNILVPKKKGKK